MRSLKKSKEFMTDLNWLVIIKRQSKSVVLNTSSIPFIICNAFIASDLSQSLNSQSQTP